MKRIYMHPIPVRIWHWINALSFLALIITGLQIRYRDAIQLTSFKDAVDIHNLFGFILIFNYMLWLLYYLFSGRLKVYIPVMGIGKYIKSSFRQARYYAYGIFVGEKNPHHGAPDNKFNPLQQTAYLNIMLFFIPVQMVTGLFLWDITLFSRWINIMGGIKIVDSFHVLIFLFFASFFFVHIYLATLGHTPLAHIKAMFTGYEEAHEETEH